jgi:hypothetical protein
MPVDEPNNPEAAPDAASNIFENHRLEDRYADLAPRNTIHSGQATCLVSDLMLFLFDFSDPIFPNPLT